MAQSITGVTGGLIAIAGGSTGTLLAQTTRKYTVLIGGTDRSRYVANPSITVTAQLGSRATASLKVIPKDGVSYAPELWDEIIIINNLTGYRLFSGYVESTTRNNFTGSSGQYEIDVKCSDYGQILDRRLVAKFYNAANGSFAGIITYDLVTRFLDGTGITYSYMGADGYVGDEVLFNWVYASEAINQIADRANLEWRINQHKVLGYISRDTGSGPAPFELAANDGNWRSILINESKTRFANSVKVRSSQDVAALWTDEVEAAGEHIYFTQYPMDVKPTLVIDGVEVDEDLVCENAERATTTGWEWYYFQGYPGVHHNQSMAAPTGVTVEIVYPSRVSYVAVAEDAESIDEVGLWELIEDAKDVTNLDALQTYAEGLLARHAIVPVDLTIESDRVGLEPGQLLSLDNACGITGDFVVEQVDTREIAKDWMRYTVQASNAPQRAKRGANFFTKLIAAGRLPVDRIDAEIGFTLAETINGEDNPGLEVIEPEAYRLAQSLAI